MKFVSQLESFDCGFACLKMLLCHLNKDSNYLLLQGEKKETYSYQDLIDIASNHNLSLIGYKYDSSVLCLKKNVPFIASIVNECGLHAVVVSKIGKHSVTYYDPAIGKVRRSLISFDEIWNKTTLEISCFEKTKCETIYPHLISKRRKLLLSTLQFGSGLACVIATLFIDKSPYLFISLVCFSLYFVFEILSRLILIKTMQKMDEEHLYSFINKRNHYYQMFESFNEARKLVLIYPMNLIIALLSTVLVITIVILNGVYHLWYLFSPIALAFIGGAIFLPKLKKLNRTISIEESKLKNCRTDQEFIILTRSINNQTYRVAFLTSLFHYGSILLILCGVIIVMSLSGAISLPLLVFYLSMGIFIKNNITNILSSVIEHDEVYSKLNTFLSFKAGKNNEKE